MHSQSTFSVSSPPPRSQTAVPGLEGAALDSYILAEAESIRRERLERRQKKASAAETAPDAGELREKAGQQRKGTEEAKVLVGNLIGEDHVNYVLMYNMLTGIRIGVSGPGYSF
jgi:1-phosphatidylinositol-4-phosphate 5-kinase